LSARPGRANIFGMKKASAPADKVKLYEKLVATIPEVQRKGATHPYTALNGNMFSYLHPSGSMAYGAVQKEYVTVPDALLKNTKHYRNTSS
jgi:hypothetical protein